MIDYPSLRRLFATGECTTTEAVAQAAREGEVVALALAADPGLAKWLAQPAKRQAVIDAALEQATMVAAYALGAERAVLLKGSASARLVYEPGQRFRRDIDLLVADIPSARDKLLRAGFVDRADPARRAEGPSHVRAWPMAWAAPFGEVELDLHRSLTAYRWCDLDPAAFLSNAVAKTPLAITDPIDTLIHTAVHLVDNGLRQPLKAWLDVHRLAPLAAPDAVIARATQYRTRTATWACLHVAHRWFGTAAPPPALAPAHAPALAFLLSGSDAHPHLRLVSRARARDLARFLLADDLRARARYLFQRLA